MNGGLIGASASTIEAMIGRGLPRQQSLRRLRTAGASRCDKRWPRITANL
jgi:hypothetical protein